MVGPYCPEGDGGNSTVTNQDEQMILNATVSAVAIQNTSLGTEDDSYVTPGFGDGDVAGS